MSTGGRDAARPNIVLFTTDQQRYDCAGSDHISFLRTPHFDRICREGITFTSARADCPICVPSRISIMTGKTVFRHGMARNGETSEVMGRHKTLPSLLHDFGYHTAAIGKMHFSPMRTRHGFDEMILPADYYRSMHRSGSPVQPMRHGLSQTILYPTMATEPECMTMTSWTAEQCVEYILERRDPSVPFFLWCSFAKPHPPLDPPEPYYSMYRDCEIPEPMFGNWSEDKHCPEALLRFRQCKSQDIVPLNIIREARAAYYGLITQIDYNMGRVFAALGDRNLLDDTLIAYTSDHGEYLGDHHLGSKIFFHESAAHVPFALRLPRSWNNRNHGRSVATPVCHADLLPTLLRAAGGNPPEDADGIDLIALANGEIEPRQFLYSWTGHYSDCDQLAVTDGTWKYIWYPEGGVEQLFNLKEDPAEQFDLVLSMEADANSKSKVQDMLGSLRKTLVEGLETRAPQFIRNGSLITKPVRKEDVRDRRNALIDTWVTDYTDRPGVRH